MQHDHVLKKFNFDLLTYPKIVDPIPRVVGGGRVGGGWSSGKILATMLLHL